MSETDMHVARTVSFLAELNGLSLRALAEKVGMPYRTVQNYLTGEVKIPSEFVAKCCRHLAVEADYLLNNRIDIVQENLALAINDVFRNVFSSLTYEGGELHIREPGATGFDDPRARELHHGALLTQVAAAIRHNYVRRRMIDLQNEDGASPLPVPASRASTG